MAARPCFTRDRPETDRVFSKFKELLDLPLAKAGNSSQTKGRLSESMLSGGNVDGVRFHERKTTGGLGLLDRDFVVGLSVCRRRPQGSTYPGSPDHGGVLPRLSVPSEAAHSGRQEARP